MARLGQVVNFVCFILSQLHILPFLSLLLLSNFFEVVNTFQCPSLTDRFAFVVFLQAVCILVAVSIHYFYLAGFAWMLMEGIYLYLMVVKVFNTFVKLKLFYVFAWGT